MYKGRIQEKNGFYHVVINYVDEYGKRKEPWFSTKLKIKGNKKEALKLLEIACNNFNPKLLDYYRSNKINIFDKNPLSIGLKKSSVYVKGIAFLFINGLSQHLGDIFFHECHVLVVHKRIQH